MATKPIFTTAQIIDQLTTSWGGIDEGSARTWDGNTIFYSIPTTSPDGFNFPYTFSALFNSTTRGLAREAFELWDDLIAPSLTETTDKNEKITLCWSSTGFDDSTLGAAHTDKHGIYPDYQIDQSRVWINANSVVPQILDEVGVGGIWTFLHEIGHALGLSHPGSYNGGAETLPSYDTDAEYAQDTYQFSVMSYFDETNFGNADYFNPDDTSSFINTPSTPMLHDVLAIQAKYGADPNTRTGNTTYGFNSTAGRAAFDFSINVDPVITIYDAGGSDTLNCSGYSHDQTISLVPGTYSSIGALTDNVAIAFNTVIEIALGGSGNDRIIGNEFFNTLDGGGGNDVLIGGGGADGMLGGKGEDILDARDSDTSTDPAVLSGGELSDTYIVGKSTDIVLEDDIFGVDWVIAFGTSFTLPDNVENLSLLPDGSSTNFVLTGNAEGNRIEGDGNANTLLGLDGRDHLFGFDGNDDLTGGLGVDELDGGPGADRFIFQSGDEVTPAVSIAETIDGGTNSGGFDTLVLKNTGTIDFGHVVLSEIEAVQFFSGTSTAMFDDTFAQIGTVGISRVTGNAGSVDTLVVNGDATNLSTLTFLTWGTNDLVILNGLGGGDTLTGSSQNDTLNGFGGNDTLNGGAGNDILNGGLGGDQLNGGTGTGSIDTASYADAAAGANGAGVTASLLDPSQNTGEAAGDKYNSIENLIGSAFDDTLEGSAGANTISGGGGDDTIAGGAGADILDGGPGNDGFVFRSGSDVVAGESISGGTGFDALVLENAGTVDFGASPLSSIEILQFASGTSTAIFTAGNGAIGILAGNAASVDTIVVNGITNLDLTPVIFVTSWSANDVIVLNGTGGGDTITGTDQNDTINGFGAADTLNGGAGTDTMSGGAGNDGYFVDNIGDVVIENVGEGTDTVNTSLNYTLAANVERLVMLGTADLQGYGNTLNNDIVGNSGNNLIDGGAGADTMVGAAGNDVYFVDNSLDVVSENVNQGNDSVFSSVSFTLSANVENLILQGSADLQGYGSGGANVLYGNTGNNLLNGNGGVDLMAGGTGDDVYFADNSSDSAFEVASQGNDSVFATTSYGLAADVENLILQGTGDFQAYGNSQANVIYGNSGSNLINAGGGIDLMAGGAGNDIYNVDDPSDVCFEVANQGNDSVFATCNYGLSADVENLILQGSADLQGYGNNTANTIYGNSGNNLINAGGGIDLMVGGAGNDIYFVDNSSDSVFEVANEGNDSVFAGVSYALSANVEGLVLQGAGNLDGIGSALANVIAGNSGINTLDGGGGADQLTGNAGNDIFLFRPGQANGDTVVDFAGNGAATGDALQFVGYGAGATFTNIDATHWQVNYNGGSSHDIITFMNGAPIDPTDFLFS